MRIVTVCGIRSQFMKLASFSRAVANWNRDNPDQFTEIISVNSGQHYDEKLYAQYREEYNLVFNFDLSDRHRGLPSTQVLSAMLWEIEEILARITNIDVVLVFGDANSTLAGALAAKRMGHLLGHVEAGLRTFNMQSVEEINRIVVDRISDIHFLSREEDRKNLLKEGIGDHVFFVGDLILDLVGLSRHERAREGVLITMHRKENTRDLEYFHSFIMRLLEYGHSVVVICHPTTKEVIWNRWQREGRVTVLESLPHNELLSLVKRSRFGVTDSGALQREAYYVGTRLLICQDNVFWGNLTEHGVHLQIGKTVDELERGVRWMAEMQRVPVPILDEFGMGNAGAMIIENLWRWRSRHVAMEKF